MEIFSLRIVCKNHIPFSLNYTKWVLPTSKETLKSITVKIVCKLENLEDSTLASLIQAGLGAEFASTELYAR